jgi:uncharacterized protein YdcH (DUF465 family)
MDGRDQLRNVLLQNIAELGDLIAHVETDYSAVSTRCEQLRQEKLVLVDQRSTLVNALYAMFRESFPPTPRPDESEVR